MTGKELMALCYEAMGCVAPCWEHLVGAVQLEWNLRADRINEKLADNWISVEERKPNNKRFRHVQAVTGDVIIARYLLAKDKWMGESGVMFDNSEILFWKRIPKAREEK